MNEGKRTLSWVEQTLFELEMTPDEKKVCLELLGAAERDVPPFGPLIPPTPPPLPLPLAPVALMRGCSCSPGDPKYVFWLNLVLLESLPREALLQKIAAAV